MSTPHFGSPKPIISTVPRERNTVSVFCLVFLIVGVGAFGYAKKNPTPTHQTTQQTAIELPELSDSASLPQHWLASPDCTPLRILKDST